MKRSIIVVSSFAVLGAGVLALVRQQTPVSDHPTRNASPSRKRELVQPPVVVHGNKDNVTGRAGDQAELMKLRSIQSFIKQGKAAMSGEQFAQAESIFRQALKTEPNDAMTLRLLAEVYEREGMHTKAIEAYRTLIYSNAHSSISSDPTTLMHFVLSLCRSNQYAEAVQVFNKTMDDSAHGSIPEEVIVNAQRTGNTVAFAPYIEKYSLLPMRFDVNNLEENKLQAAAHFVLGTKQPSFAPPGAGEQMRHLQAAVRLAPKWGQAHSALADALVKKGQTQAAQAAQKRALALGDHSSIKERLIHANDEGQHAHQLLYHPDHPEYYHYHDPKMIPTKAEVDAALIELKKKNSANPTVPKRN